MIGIEAPWVGKTPEEYEGSEEYNFTITMTGEITVYAKDRESALEKVKDMSRYELFDYIDDFDID